MLSLSNGVPLDDSKDTNEQCKKLCAEYIELPGEGNYILSVPSLELITEQHICKLLITAMYMMEEQYVTMQFAKDHRQIKNMSRKMNGVVN